jgi:hypothetical protein
MEITLPIFQDLSISIGDSPRDAGLYATSRLQKGWVLHRGNNDLAEEAVGFGFPVLKRGLQAFFPGAVQLDLVRQDPKPVITAAYTLDLVEKIARPGRESVKNKTLYRVKDSLAYVIRGFPPGRSLLTALSSGLRWMFGWETTYEKTGLSAQLKITYTIDEQAGVLTMHADLDEIDAATVSEVIIMNEQGAHAFDQYRDTSGIRLAGRKIGVWDEVHADEASFASSTQRVAFSLPRVPGVRFFRGRERIASRLAWAGFGYSFAPTVRRFGSRVRIETLP